MPTCAAPGQGRQPGQLWPPAPCCFFGQGNLGSQVPSDRAGQGGQPPSPRAGQGIGASRHLAGLGGRSSCSLPAREAWAPPAAEAGWAAAPAAEPPDRGVARPTGGGSSPEGGAPALGAIMGDGGVFFPLRRSGGEERPRE